MSDRDYSVNKERPLTDEEHEELSRQRDRGGVLDRTSHFMVSELDDLDPEA